MIDDTGDPVLEGLGRIDAYAVVRVSPEGRIVLWNVGAERLTGFPPDVALGQDLAELLSLEPGTLRPEYLAEAAASGGERGLWLGRVDASHFWGKVAVAAVPDGTGGAAGFALLFRDATSLKLIRDELERSRTMFEGILAIASDAVVCVDETQRVIFFNEGAEKIFGYTPDEVLGQPLEVLIPERFRSGHAAHVEEFGRGPVAARQMGERGEIAGRRRSGEIFPAEASISKLDTGRGRIYTAVLRDVTDRRLAEEALSQRTEDLARSNAELEQFAYVASHDLQEPLRMVASYTQLLARRYRGKLDEDADEFIGFAVDGVTRMQGLINDLLTFSRVGTRGGGFGDVSTQKVLEKVLITLRPAIEDAGVELTADPLPDVTGDAGQISQLLQNLVQNAIKFSTKTGERPRVRIGAVDGGSQWQFFVSDNGIGIAPEFHERIFVIFQRLHNREEYPGTGIGLAICKKIVERHRGRIWVESEVGHGSTFHFTLPKAEQVE
jgi:PAS domain S-box-containing protein